MGDLPERLSQRYYWRARELVWEARRQALLTRIRMQAAAQGADVRVEIPPGTRIGRDIYVEIRSRVSSTITFRGKGLIGDRVRFYVNGGSLLVEDGFQLRAGSVLVVGAPVHLMGENTLSWNSYLSADYGITLGLYSSMAQLCTIIDVEHFYGPEPDVSNNNRGAPIVIGENVWIATGAIVTSGVTVGDESVIGAQAVVTRDVPPGHLALGVPAKCRPMPESIDPEGRVRARWP